MAYQRKLPAELVWRDDTIVSPEEAASKGFKSFREIGLEYALSPAAVKNKIVSGHYRVLAVDRPFEEVYIDPSTVLKAGKAPKGFGPYREINLDMLTDESRESLAGHEDRKPTGIVKGKQPVTAASKSKAKLLDAVAGSTADESEVHVFKRNPHGRDVWVDSLPEVPSLKVLQDQWGGGEYLLKVVENGEVVNERRVPVQGEDTVNWSSTVSRRAREQHGTFGGRDERNHDNRIMELLNKDPTADIGQAMAAQTNATANAMEKAANIAKGDQSSLKEIATVLTGAHKQQQLSHQQLMEQIHTQHTHMLQRDQHRADADMRRLEERTKADRESADKRIESDRLRDQQFLQSMREADAKVQESLQKALDAQQEGINQQRSWLSEWQQNERKHLDEMREIRSGDPQDKTLAVLSTVLGQVDQTAGRVIDAATRNADRNGTTAGNGQAAAPSLAGPTSSNGSGNGHSLMSGLAGLSADALKADVFGSDVVRGILQEADRHVAKDIDAGNLAVAIFEIAMSNPALKMPLAFMASRSIREVLTEGKLEGKYPHLESDKGHAWFEELKRQLFTPPQAPPEDDGSDGGSGTSDDFPTGFDPEAPPVNRVEAADPATAK